jgi:hypothetical protein
VFPAQDAAAYEQVIGRWSRRLAPMLPGLSVATLSDEA